MNLEPGEVQVAMEYALLYETKQQAQARRIFDRISGRRETESPKACHNFDDPLGTGITR